MITENIVDTTIKALSSMVQKTDEINKRLVTAIIVVSLVWGIALCVIMGFYFIGQGYPDTSQTVEDGNGKKIEQQVTKGTVTGGGK